MLQVEPRIALVSALLAPCLLSCNVYDPELAQGGGLGRPPSRPNIPDDPEDSEELVFALRQVVLRQSGGEELWRTIGIDLDGVATTEDNLVQACTPQNLPDWEPDPIMGEVQLDGENGIDNVFGASYYLWISSVISRPETRARESHDIGNGTIIARVRGWNGTANDSKVEVTVGQAAGGTPLDPELVHFEDFELLQNEDGMPAPPPAWDGTDNWWLRDDGFAEGDPNRPFLFDDNGYVVNGTLVHRLSNHRRIFFVMRDQTVQVILTGAWVIAKMNDDFTALTDVVVAGRWAIDDLLSTAGHVGLCQDHGARTLLERRGRQTADVMSDPLRDHTGSACDAISIAVRFEEGVAGNLIGLAPAQPLVDLCEEEDADD